MDDNERLIRLRSLLDDGSLSEPEFDKLTMESPSEKRSRGHKLAIAEIKVGKLRSHRPIV